MRYIRQIVTTSTISDDDIKEEESLRNLLVNLSKVSVNIQIEYEDERTKTNKRYEMSRILRVHDNKIDIRAFHGSGSLIDRNIPFKNIKEVILTTAKDNIIVGEIKISKATFLDI